jgi:hypothetical protein
MDAQIQSTTNTHDDENLPALRPPVAGWREITLAVLPFLLILLTDALPKLLVEGGLMTWEDAGMRFLNTSLTLVLIGCLLMAFFLAWRRKWPVWSATWVPFFCVPLLLLMVVLYNFFSQGQLSLTITQEMLTYVWIPLFVAVLLYAVTRLDPLRGLLAALPVIYLLWIPNMEFVPDTIEAAIKIASLTLVCLAIAFVLRRGDWRTGLYAILGLNLAVGALFAYAGIYHGGTLPFVAPGPNLVEVLRSLVPQYLATSAILLGPLFAWRFRQQGRSNGQGGIIAYHLALAGLLLVIMANLAGLSMTMQSNTHGPDSQGMTPLLLLGLGLYLVGVIWLYRYGPYPSTASGWAKTVLLPLLPLGIPIALMLPFITWQWPISDLYGIPLLWVLPHALSLSLGLAWLGLSIWVITQPETNSLPLIPAPATG